MKLLSRNRALLIACAALGFSSTAACTGTVGSGTGSLAPGATRGGSSGLGGGGATPGGFGAGVGVGSGAAGAPGSSGGGLGAGAGLGSVSAACSGATAQPAAAHARLLSPTQYDNTVLDLFKVGGNPAETNNVAGGETAALDATALQFRASAAAAVAAQASANLSAWSPCVPANAAAQQACEQQLIDKIGQRGYRRPLSADDSARMKALFDAGIAAGNDFATGVDWFLTGLLQTPDFQYQLVRPASSEQPGQMVAISEYEMASRLSYYVWDSMPDDALFAAAAAGLGDLGSVQAQVTRMTLDTTRLKRGVTAFYSNWLNTPAYSEGIVKNDASGKPDPAFTQTVALSLGQSILMGATELYASPSPNISSLFSGESYYLNDTLMSYYRLGGAGTSDFKPVAMPGQHRSGLLTHPGFLTINARPQVTAPILRGAFVTSNLLCLGLVVPDNLVIPPLAETPQAGLTTRELVDQTHVQLGCQACHNIIDPPGFALEGFDQVGNVRATDNGKPVDTSGNMVNAGDLNGAFASGDQFLSRIAQSDTVKACFAQEFLEHALSGEVSTSVQASDRCSVTRVSAEFAKSGDLVALVGLVAASDSFRLRTSEGAPQ